MTDRFTYLNFSPDNAAKAKAVYTGEVAPALPGETALLFRGMINKGRVSGTKR